MRTRRLFGGSKVATESFGSHLKFSESRPTIERPPLAWCVYGDDPSADASTPTGHRVRVGRRFLAEKTSFLQRNAVKAFPAASYIDSGDNYRHLVGKKSRQRRKDLSSLLGL